MQATLTTKGLAIAILAGLLGCSSDPRSTPPVRLVAPIVAERLPAAPPGKLSEKKRRFREAAVYVDGNLRGILRRLELPGTLKPRKKKLLDGRAVNRFAIADYIAAIGLDLEKVRAVHLHGGRGRASIIDGDLLRKYKDTLAFSFTQGDRGKPRAAWPGDDGFRINTTIDIVSALAIYVEKVPPEFDPRIRKLVLDGQPVEGVAYVPAEELKGTRVYSDGAMVAAMKRKTLPDKLLVPGASVRNPRFSMVLWLESIGVDPAAVRSAEYLIGDDVVARSDAKQWPEARKSLEFSIPRRSQGRLLLHFAPGTATLAPGAKEPAEAKISAILLQVKAPASGLELSPIREEKARGEGGSGPDQPASENPEKNGGEGPAQPMQDDE